MHNIGSRPSWVYRCIAYFWCFSSCIILTKVYSNVVLSMLASPDYLVLVRAIHELPNKPDVVVYVYGGSNTDIYFSVRNLLCSPIL